MRNTEIDLCRLTPLGARRMIDGERLIGVAFAVEQFVFSEDTGQKPDILIRDYRWQAPETGHDYTTVRLVPGEYEGITF